MRPFRLETNNGIKGTSIGTSIVDTKQLAQVSKTIKYSVKDVLAQSISRAESTIAYNFFFNSMLHE